MWKVASHCTHSTVGAIIWLIGYYQATGKLKSKLKGELKRQAKKANE